MAGWAAFFAVTGVLAAAIGFGAAGAAATVGQLVFFPAVIAALVSLVLSTTRGAAE